MEFECCNFFYKSLRAIIRFTWDVLNKMSMILGNNCVELELDVACMLKNVQDLWI